MRHLQIKRPGEQLGQAASRERDFDAIGSDFHAAKQCHERRFDFVRRGGSEFFRYLTATFDQLAPPWVTVRIIVNGIEDRSGAGEKCAKPVDTRPSKLPAGIRRPLERFLPAPVMREVET
jgi:hypothetical protein